ncbi:unnamed protein product [Trifolium pratense]|uniref:Uncharacterized protein n=1 Tax=Trifolium pratense TaxID=57577 RepID=A0ACB0K7U7_TRIPR|nr:unnamed protein product [Trifolium pratense]
MLKLSGITIPAKSSLHMITIFRVVAAILHIGNIDFAKGKEIDSSVPKDDKAKFHLKTSSQSSEHIRQVLSINISDIELAHIACNFTKLTELDLYRCVRVYHKSKTSLDVLQQLQSVNISLVIILVGVQLFQVLHGRLQ